MAYVNVRNDVLAVGITSVNVSPEPIGKKRKAIVLTNTSAGAHIISICLGDNAALQNRGIPLQVNERMVDVSSEGYECYQGPIKCISSLAGGQLTILERFED